MPVAKNVSGFDLEVPVLRARVEAGATVEVPDDLVESFGNANWEIKDSGRVSRKHVTELAEHVNNDPGEN